MSDLDARVVALKVCPFCGREPKLLDLAGWEVQCDCGVNMCLASPEQAAVIKAWNQRAELQKPALHEPVTDAEVERAAFEAWAKEYGRIFLDKTSFESMKGERYTCAWTQEAWVGWQARAALSKRKEAMHLHKFEALGAEDPAQEEITDAEILLPKPDCPNIWGGCYSEKLVREIIRASKGEKT